MLTPGQGNYRLLTKIFNMLLILIAFGKAWCDQPRIKKNTNCPRGGAWKLRFLTDVLLPFREEKMQLGTPDRISNVTCKDFMEMSRKLFGNIHQRFFHSSEPPRSDISFSSFGVCRLSKISASPHSVTGDKVTSGDEEDSIKVLVQVSGKSLFRQGSDKIRLRNRSAVLYDPSRPYFLVNTTRVDQLVLQIPRSVLSDRTLSRLATPLPLSHEGTNQSATLTSFILTSAENEAAMSNEMKASMGLSLACFAQGLICDSFGTAMIETVGTASQMLLRERIKDYIRQHLSDPDLSLETIARAMGCSIRYLHRAFEGETMTPQRYIWQSRLDHSRALLVSPSHSRLSIAEIAYHCGFNSSSHFSRLFRERFELAPRDLRLSH